MKTTTDRKRWVLALAAATVLLGACGSRDDDDAPPPPADPLTGVPASAGQSSAGFIAYLRTLVAIKSETAEPFTLDGFTAPVSDTTEPEPL